MTLVLAAVTHDFAIVASDQRITHQVRRADDSVEPIAQGSNDIKTIIWDCRYAMGFAGVGRLKNVGAKPNLDANGVELGIRLEAWLSKAMKGEDHWADGFAHLAEQFSSVAEQIHLAGPHVFLAAGFPDEGELPELVRVANSKAMKHQFDVTRDSLPPDTPYLLAHAGAPLTRAQHRTLTKALERTIERRPKQPYYLHDVFAQVIASVASTHLDVSPSCHVTSIPRSAVPLPVGAVMWMGPPSLDNYEETDITNFYTMPTVTVRSDPARINRMVVATGLRTSFSSDVIPENISPDEADLYFLPVEEGYDFNQ
jgi:hypothetical protein